MEANSILQADEVQALSAIYANDWNIEDEEHHVYNVTIQGKSKDHAVFFQVTMPPEYPQESPPLYQISAPWLKGFQRLKLSSMLEDIYCENAGQSIIFLWIEKIREYIARQENSALKKNIEIEQTPNIPVEAGQVHNNLNEIPIYHREPMTYKKSTFQAHLAPIVTKDQVSQVLNRLLENRKIASATHNIHAYRICDEDGNALHQDYDDDGEAQAGIRLLHLLQLLHIKNAIVIVSRWFGGVLLGPDRFKCINNAARGILEEYGYIKMNSSVQEDAKKKKKVK